MRTITVEEHYATAAFMDGPGRQLAALADSVREHPQVAAGYELLIEQLCDLGDGRIAAMDAAGIDVQVLSLTSPGAEQLEPAEAVAFAARRTIGWRRRCGAIRSASPGSLRCRPPLRRLPPTNWSARSVNMVLRAR